MRHLRWLLLLVCAACTTQQADHPRVGSYVPPVPLSMSATCGTSVYTNGNAANVNGSLPVTIIGSAGTYGLSANDCGTLLSVQVYSANAIGPLPDPGTLWPGYWVYLQNIQGGVWTINPGSKLLNGSSSNIVLYQYMGGILITDGSNWYFLGSYALPIANPILSSCGTSPSVDANATQYSGKVTAGTGTVTGCTVTFASGFATYAHCRVTPETAGLSSFGYTYTTSAISVVATSLTSAVFDYECDGH